MASSSFNPPYEEIEEAFLKSWYWFGQVLPPEFMQPTNHQATTAAAPPPQSSTSNSRKRQRGGTIEERLKRTNVEEEGGTGALDPNGSVYASGSRVPIATECTSKTAIKHDPQGPACDVVEKMPNLKPRGSIKRERKGVKNQFGSGKAQYSLRFRTEDEVDQLADSFSCKLKLDDETITSNVLIETHPTLWLQNCEINPMEPHL